MRLRLFAATCAAALIVAAPAALAADAAPVAPVHYGTWGVDLSTRDLKVAPGDDFFEYAQGTWFASAQIPPDQADTDSFYVIYNRTQDQLRGIIEAAAADPKTPTAAQIGGLYKAFMDEARVEALDAAPLQPDLARIAAVKDKAAFTVLMGQTYGRFGAALIGVGVGPDPRHPQVNILDLGQAGISLPDRDYYLTDGFKAQRDAFAAYLLRTFTLIGYPDPAGAAQSVMALESRIAKVR
jgi:putative endopeptidase